jgi:hypothetical protein
MQITRQDIDTVIDFHATVVGTKYHKAKREMFVTGVSKLTEPALWLLTFSCWFSLFNTRFFQIDESNYFSIPEQDTSSATFEEFIAVIQRYNRLRVTPKREKALVSFLSKCDRRDKDFYLLLLSKTFHKHLPITEVQQVLRLDTIRISEVYGSVELLSTGFSDLHYPVAISAVSAAELSVVGVVKFGYRVIYFKVQDGKAVTTKPFLKENMRFINSPRFVLVGYSWVDKESKRDHFTPVDFFSTYKEFKRYMAGGEAEQYETRITKLRKFKSDNFLTQVTSEHVGLAETEGEMLAEIAKSMTKSKHKFCVLSDERTVKTGTAHAVEVRAVNGIIEDYWVLCGEVLGFLCWFNGELFKVHYSFEGKENSLLNSILPARNKQVEFLYLKVGKHRIGVGRKILWNKLPWRPRRMKLAAPRLEKCAFCGDTKYPHACRGLCETCESNLFHMLDKYGPYVWITPSKIIRTKRHKTGWEPTYMNLFGFSRCRGYSVESDEDGRYRFILNSEWEEKGYPQIAVASVNRNPTKDERGQGIHPEPEQVQKHAPHDAEPGQG